MARPKSAAERKHSKEFRLRLLPAQDSLFRQAAEYAGITISDWARDRLTRAARSELGELAGPKKSSARP